MIVRHVTALGAVALALSATSALAGPCSQQIYETEVALNEKLDAAAAAGKAGAESPAATMHRQPTPNSVVGAEERLGEFPEEDAEAFSGAMDEARKADDAGDLGACQKALTEANRVLQR